MTLGECPPPGESISRRALATQDGASVLKVAWRAVGATLHGRTRRVSEWGARRPGRCLEFGHELFPTEFQQWGRLFCWSTATVARAGFARGRADFRRIDD